MSAIRRDAIAITGMGSVSPLGLDAQDVLAACKAGTSAIGPIEKIDGLSGMPLVAAVAPAFDVENYLRFRKNAKFMKRAVKCAVVAAYQAVGDSGIEWGGLAPERIAVFTASGQTNAEYETFFPGFEAAWEAPREYDYKYLGKREARAIDRYFSLRTLANGGLALLSLELGARGCASNHTQGDGAFATALRTAQYDLMADRCDVAVVGGYDCLLTAANYLAYTEAGLLASGSYRPFDRDRTGIVLGEGAAFFVLERAADAKARGARVLAGLRGIGTIHDCSHGVNIEWQQCDLYSVLEAAGFGVREFDYAVAHGLGTRDADRSESESWVAASAGDLPVTALKGLTGYLGAAAPAVELWIGITCSRAGFVPPVAGLESADPDIPINLMRGAPRILTAELTNAGGASGLFVARSFTGQVSAIGVQNE